METRQYWIDTMLRIADPVLRHLAAGTLKGSMPTAFHPDRAEYMHLEALGRTLCGMAPWLELEPVSGGEAALQEEYRILARRAIASATDPASPDYMNFTQGYGQALVDAAFLAHGIVRAPRQLFGQLNDEAKGHVIRALKDTRRFTPYVSNWLFFSAMVEAALHVMGEKDADMTRVDYAVQMFESWYLGDGTYGDGPQFHWDYYNSFVIHPMYVDVLRTFKDTGRGYDRLLAECEKRAARYAAILERLIGPDGTYPIMGRSVTYRFGTFQLLSQAALQGFLPEELHPAQARCALDAVIRRVMESKDMFDAQGWLQPGVYGCQPGLAEGYICVGSLYLCESVFLALGLPASDEFWRTPDRPWTAKRIWQGDDMPCDHAVD
ncbi:MAG: DUF2264 domain-containing protein [Clostridia bacterium]|nr:DUF2264 domain-containing protein [Clostridia bacterium]